MRAIAIVALAMLAGCGHKIVKTAPVTVTQYSTDEGVFCNPPVENCQYIKIMPAGGRIEVDLGDKRK